MTTTTNETSLNQFLSAFQDAYNAHDPAAVARLYTDEARWMAAAGVVLQGREVLATALAYFMAAVPPVLTLNERDRIVTGDQAVSIGTYALDGEVEGQTASVGGAYLNILRKNGQGWRIIGQQMNYDFPVTAQQWVGKTEFMETLAASGTLGTLVETFESRYNRGDQSKLPELFTDDGWVSFAAAPLMVSRDALARLVREDAQKSCRLRIHDLNTLEIGGGIVVDTGWYVCITRTNPVWWGTYSLVARQKPDGGQFIHWLVCTRSPSDEPAA